MATLVVTSIMVDSDDPATVNRTIKNMLRSAVFESDNPIVDFDITLEQNGIQVSPHIEEGQMIASIHDALQAA